MNATEIEIAEAFNRALCEKWESEEFERLALGDPDEPMASFRERMDALQDRMDALTMSGPYFYGPTAVRVLRAQPAFDRLRDRYRDLYEAVEREPEKWLEVA